MNKFWTILFQPRAFTAKLLLVIFFMGFLALGYLDYLEPIKNFLDSEILSFKIGETRFSLYLLTKSLIIIILLFWLAGIFSEFGEKRINAIRDIKANNKMLLTKSFQVTVNFFAFIIMLNILGIDLTAFAIFSGAIGIGIGFGLQKITSNFISGIILLFEKFIKNGDLVELANGNYGYVRHIAARYTLIETFDGKEVMIPNENFITNTVTNWTHSNKKARVEITIGVSYESDIEKAMQLILEAAREHPRCVLKPEPVCYLRQFADSSIMFLLHFWVNDVTMGMYSASSDVMRNIWKKFKKHNIVIPFPQADVYIKNSPPNAAQ